MATTTAVIAIWAIGAVLAWFSIKEWQGSTYTGSVKQKIENGIMSASSWLIFVLYLIHYLHNKKW